MKKVLLVLLICVMINSGRELYNAGKAMLAEIPKQCLNYYRNTSCNPINILLNMEESGIEKMECFGLVVFLNPE